MTAPLSDTLQYSHRYSIHEEGAGANVRATLLPGLTNRLTKYLRTTQQLIEEGRDAVISKELGDFTGINPVQVRRDLSAIGFSGTRGVGYQAYDLVEAVRNILERVMNSIRNGLGMRETEIVREPIRPWNPHFYATFVQVHNTL
jgi:hypothetical protein